MFWLGLLRGFVNPRRAAWPAERSRDAAAIPGTGPKRPAPSIFSAWGTPWNSAMMPTKLRQPHGKAYLPGWAPRLPADSLAGTSSQHHLAVMWTTRKATMASVITLWEEEEPSSQSAEWLEKLIIRHWILSWFLYAADNWKTLPYFFFKSQHAVHFFSRNLAQLVYLFSFLPRCKFSEDRVYIYFVYLPPSTVTDTELAFSKYMPNK